MDISNELLAAYAEGNVTKEERNQVRQYLAEHPQEIESIMMMMDEDYELSLGDEFAGTAPKMAAKVLKRSLLTDVCCSAAAFAPGKKPEIKVTQKFKSKPRDDFDARLTELMDDLGI